MMAGWKRLIQHKGHAMSRYTAVTEGVIEVCQRDYSAGRVVGRSIPGLDPDTATLIAIQSLAADALLDPPPDVLLTTPLDPLDDWSLAVLAEIHLALIGEAKAKTKPPQENQDQFAERAWVALEQAVDSATASPMLWYEGIFFDLAREYQVKSDPRAIDLLKRGLAHNLRYNEGDNAENFLRDLAEAHLSLGDLDRGIEILTSLLRNDPQHIWAYNSAGFALGRVGLADLGIEATRRGLEVIAATGDPEKLRRQFLDFLDDLCQNEMTRREKDLDPAVLAGFRAALALDLGEGLGQSIAKLCHEMVPDLDQMPVKEPAKLAEQAPQPGERKRAAPNPRRKTRRKRKRMKRR